MAPIGPLSSFTPQTRLEAILRTLGLDQAKQQLLVVDPTGKAQELLFTQLRRQSLVVDWEASPLPASCEAYLQQEISEALRRAFAQRVQLYQLGGFNCDHLNYSSWALGLLVKGLIKQDDGTSLIGSIDRFSRLMMAESQTPVVPEFVYETCDAKLASRYKRAIPAGQRQLARFLVMSSRDFSLSSESATDVNRDRILSSLTTILGFPWMDSSWQQTIVSLARFYQCDPTHPQQVPHLMRERALEVIYDTPRKTPSSKIFAESASFLEFTQYVLQLMNCAGFGYELSNFFSTNPEERHQAYISQSLASEFALCLGQMVFAKEQRLNEVFSAAHQIGQAIGPHAQYFAAEIASFSSTEDAIEVPHYAALVLYRALYEAGPKAAIAVIINKVEEIAYRMKRFTNLLFDRNASMGARFESVLTHLTEGTFLLLYPPQRQKLLGYFFYLTFPKFLQLEEDWRELPFHLEMVIRDHASLLEKMVNLEVGKM